MKKFLGIAAALALALTGCSSADTSDATNNTPDQVTIGLTYIPNIQFAPIYMAEANGFFEDAGLDVTIRHHGAQEALFGALEDGTEDVVFAGADEMMQARSTGVDVVNWATMYQQYPVVLIAPLDSGIDTPADLAGKRVGLPGPYGENYFGLQAMLRDYQLEDSVTVEYIGYTQAAALSEQKVDAIIGFQNNDTIALENAGIPVKNIPLVAEDLPLIGVGLGSVAEKIDVDVYARLLGAIEKGAQAAGKDIDATIAVTKEYVPSLAEADQAELAKKVLTATLKLYQGGEVFGKQHEDTWVAMADFLSEIGVLDKPVTAKDAYTTKVLEARN
ncbi:MAG: ABC transporter substrate-binding protein [Trueperella sp.]|nr:ABC transporter substrate-binding protein [Trueperella sp.]